MNSEYKFFKIYEGVWVMVCRLVEHDELKSGSTGSIVTAGVVKAQ